jgi:uncharacterized protein YbaP (TraB family)
MKKALLILGFLWGIVAGAQTPKTLLWKISGNGLQSPSYLFGTIHMTCDATLKPKVLEALDKTAQLCLELDMDDSQLQMEVLKHMYMKNNARLDSLLTPEEFKTLDSYLKKNLGMSAKMLNRVQPFFITSMLYPKLLSCKTQSVESALMQVSKSQNEEVIGLETAEEQMNAFNAIPYKDQAKDLFAMSQKNIEDDKAETDKLTKLYQDEDIDGLYKYMNDVDSKTYAKFEDDLLVKRNKNWQERIPKIIQSKPTFIGVGAAHLGGKNGVIQLLKNSGFKVEPVL